MKQLDLFDNLTHACKIVDWLKEQLGFDYTDAIDKGLGAKVAAKIRALKSKEQVK